MFRKGSRPSLWSLTLLLALLLTPESQAHPVPRRNHDRTIVVRLANDGPSGQLLVAVDYRLEVDEFTVVFDDLPALGDKVELIKLSRPAEFYEAFMRGYAPILAANLVATLDGKPLEFACKKHEYRLNDENGNSLGHLRCDFVFHAKAPPLLSQGLPAHNFRFTESNYELEEGSIRLSLTSDSVLKLLSKTEPDPALQARPSAELKPGDDATLRSVAASFTFTGAAPAGDREEPAQTQAEVSPEPEKPHGLLSLLLESKQGFWALLFLAAGFGAAHALTPGHGKTLVAAYLVGERGTMAHALILGLVTTLTHTGAVLALAAVLLVWFPRAVPRDVQFILGLGGGLLVAGMGFWLLLRRLAGGADHIHLGGHAHHHHAPLDHYHDEHGHAHPDGATPVSWWGLIVLGVSGGIVPCWDAIIMLGFAVSAQRLWLGLPLLLAFSAGLAAVLIAIGVAVVYVKGFASSRWGESRLFRLLPIFSAVLVTGMGLWLCYDTVHASL